jgi:hypothetical protein
MREIKFRAFDKENKIMYYLIGFRKNNSEIRIWYKKDDLIYNQSFNEKNIFLMQYAGLKNNEELYEGDIIKSGDSITCIEWEDYIDQDFYWGNACGFVFNFNPDKMDNDNNIEVIGNIYENPELLEKE